MLASTFLQEPDVRYVLLGDCNDSVAKNFDIRLSGRVLSIYDRSDREAGSCARYFPQAPGLTFEEVVLDVGRGHALFYTPERVWVDRVVEWALGR